MENELANAAQKGRLVACIVSSLQRAALRHGRHAADRSLCRVMALQQRARVSDAQQSPGLPSGTAGPAVPRRFAACPRGEDRQAKRGFARLAAAASGGKDADPVVTPTGQAAQRTLEAVPQR